MGEDINGGCGTRSGTLTPTFCSGEVGPGRFSRRQGRQWSEGHGREGMTQTELYSFI